MKKILNNSTSRYMLIVCMSAMLLFAQAFKFHLHVQQVDNTSSTSVTTGSTMGVHVAIYLHGTEIDSYQQDEVAGHHAADIVVSADSLVKQMKIFNLFVLLSVFFGILWCAPQLSRARIEYFAKTKLVPLYYLFQPPLRAPPRYSIPQL